MALAKAQGGTTNVSLHLGHVTSATYASNIFVSHLLTSIWLNMTAMCFSTHHVYCPAGHNITIVWVFDDDSRKNTRSYVLNHVCVTRGGDFAPPWPKILLCRPTRNISQNKSKITSQSNMLPPLEIWEELPMNQRGWVPNAQASCTRHPPQEELMYTLFHTAEQKAIKRAQKQDILHAILLANMKVCHLRKSHSGSGH